jgi:hypothetical protein
MEVDDLILSLRGVSPIYIYPVYKLLCTSVHLVPTEKPRGVKTAPLQDASYKTFLETKGTFISKSKSGSTNANKSLCRTLFDKDQGVSQESLFRNLFDKSCEELQDRNDAKVSQDITQLIVLSAKSLVTFNAKHLGVLIKSVSEGWNNSIPISASRPQPRNSVRFTQKAFIEDQLKKLNPYIDDLINISFGMAMYFI